MDSKRIQIDPSWTFRDEAGNTLEPQLFRLLHALYKHQKLTQAAKAAGISYRHAWNLIKKWSDFFGTDLVKLERGRGATLTTLGQKLVWAEQRVMARFQPQMANIASELNVEIHKALADVSPVLKIQASHGYAVALLPDACHGLQLDLQYSSPLQALALLNRDDCDIAGFHLASDVVVPSLVAAYRHHLKPRAHKVIRFISREQGLIVGKDNPWGIDGIKDLVASNDDELGTPKFINRQEDSGTRALFDQLLKNNDLLADDINGYHNHEYTHSAVAAYVAAGMADVGFGVKEAAHKFDLGFIPICKEDYLLVCHQKKLKQASVETFLRLISAHEFKEKINELAGYNADFSGQIEDLSAAIPTL